MQVSALRDPRCGLWAVALVALISAAVPSVARADDLQEFEQARQSYERQDYAQAVQRFERLVGGDAPRLSSEPLVLESRKYLGASYLFLGQQPKAKHQFELLLEQDPTYEIDPVAFPSEVVSVFQTVRHRLAQQRQQEEQQRRAQEAQRRRQEAARILRDRERLQRLEELAQTETVEQHNSRWIALLPFGVGQYQNGDKTLGLVLAVTEGTLSALSLGTFIAHSLIVSATPPGYVDGASADQIAAQNLATGMRITNWIATGLLALVAVGGIVDGQVRFRSVIRTTHHRPLPPSLRGGSTSHDTDGTDLQVLLSPTGAGLRVRF